MARTHRPSRRLLVLVLGGVILHGCAEESDDDAGDDHSGTTYETSPTSTTMGTSTTTTGPPDECALPEDEREQECVVEGNWVNICWSNGHCGMCDNPCEGEELCENGVCWESVRLCS